MFFFVIKTLPLIPSFPSLFFLCIHVSTEYLTKMINFDTGLVNKCKLSGLNVDDIVDDHRHPQELRLFCKR